MKGPRILETIELDNKGRIPKHLRVKYLKLAIQNGLNLTCYDLETSHAIFRGWNSGPEVSVSAKNIIAPNKIISAQWQKVDRDVVNYDYWDLVDSSKLGSNAYDDSLLISNFKDTVLNDADILLTQNGDSFDHKVLVERCCVLGLGPIINKPSLDILKLSRASMKKQSHSLDYRSTQLNLGGKNSMVEADWIDIEENGLSPTKKMIPYGCKDVLDTVSIFFIELPYYKNLPKDVEVTILKYLGYENSKPKYNIECKNCTSKNTRCNGYYTTTNGEIRKQFFCKDCNKYAGYLISDRNGKPKRVSK